MSLFAIILVIIIILLGTYVGMNKNLSDKSKSGFFVVLVVGGVFMLLLSFLLS